MLGLVDYRWRKNPAR